MNYTEELQGPVLVQADWTLNEHSACVALRGTGPSGLIITTVHESHGGVAACGDFEATGCTGPIIVHNQESLEILARYEGRIAACGIYEVSLRQAEANDVLLVPCVTQGLLLEQHRSEDSGVSVELSRLLAQTSLINEFAEVM